MNIIKQFEDSEFVSIAQTVYVFNIVSWWWGLGDDGNLYLSYFFDLKTNRSALWSSLRNSIVAGYIDIPTMKRIVKQFEPLLPFL